MRSIAGFLCLAGTAAFAADPIPSPPPSRATVAPLLNFETAAAPNSPPPGWRCRPAETCSADNVIVHGGQWSARIERAPGRTDPFSAMTLSLPVDFGGREVELRGYVRTDSVVGNAALWMRLDGPDGSVEFDNMGPRGITGTNEWKEYRIKLPLNPEGRKLFFGALLAGSGRAWVDDLQLLVDGQPLWDLPVVEPPKTALDRDHEFDGGSKLALEALTPIQVENLATLGEVWGFLKYHHPQVTAGELHWDFELLRVLPQVLGAADRAAANAVLLQWVEKLRDVPATSHAAIDADRLFLRADLAWLGDQARLGKPLVEKLHAVYEARAAGPSQFFVGFTPWVGNPIFSHEPTYGHLKLPDPGYQLLALFRYWNIIEYWFPYRDLLGEDWHATLREFIPRLALARDKPAYELQLLALITRAKDGHSNLWSSLDARPPVGPARLPASFRFLGRRAVVAAISPGFEGGPDTLQRGDIVTSLDGVALDQLVQQWSPYYAGSNDASRRRDIGQSLGRGPVGSAKVGALRDGVAMTLDVKRVPAEALHGPVAWTHDLPGPAFRLLSKDVAYLKLGAVKTADIPRYLEQASGTKGWIIDIRNYPSEFVVFTLGGSFVDRPTEFARFTIGSPADPGTFTFTPSVAVKPQVAADAKAADDHAVAAFGKQESARYPGRVIILVDETSQSQAEYTAMAFRASPRAMIIGSTTAGADGNVSKLPLPGGLGTAISGIGVYYPDRRPTQQVGIVADLEVHPTVEGIRAGRDEVLEAALHQLLSPPETATALQALHP